MFAVVTVADSISQAADFLNADPNEDLVVLGPSVAPYDALAFAEMVRMNRPAVGVVLCRDVVDNDLLIQALQSGVPRSRARLRPGRPGHPPATAPAASPARLESSGNPCAENLVFTKNPREKPSCHVPRWCELLILDYTLSFISPNVHTQAPYLALACEMVT